MGEEEEEECEENDQKIMKSSSCESEHEALRASRLIPDSCGQGQSGAAASAARRAPIQDLHGVCVLPYRQDSTK